MAVPVFQEGTMPSILQGSSASGWFFTDADTLTGRQISLDGATWGTSVNVAGGTLSIPLVNPYDAIEVDAVGLTTTGYFTFYLRAQNVNGWSAALQTTVRVYAGSASGIWRTSQAFPNPLRNGGDEPNLAWMQLYSSTARTIDGVSMPAGLLAFGGASGNSWAPVGWSTGGTGFGTSHGAVVGTFVANTKLYNQNNTTTPAFTTSADTLTAYRQFGLLADTGTWQYLVTSPAPVATSGSWNTQIFAVTKDTVIFQHQAATSGATLSLTSGSVYVSNARTLLVAHNTVDGSLRWAIGVAGTTSVTYSFAANGFASGVHGDGNDIVLPYAWSTAGTVNGATVPIGTGIVVLNTATGAVKLVLQASTSVLSISSAIIASGVYVMAILAGGSNQTVCGVSLSSGTGGVFAVGSTGTLLDYSRMTTTDMLVSPAGGSVGFATRYTNQVTFIGRTFNATGSNNYWVNHIVGRLKWVNGKFDGTALDAMYVNVGNMDAPYLSTLGSNAGLFMLPSSQYSGTYSVTLVSNSLPTLTTQATQTGWLASISMDGVGGAVSAVVGVPAGTGGAIEPPTPPAVSPTDPQTVSSKEGTTATFTVSSSDPENTQGATAIIQMWDPQLHQFFDTPIVTGTGGSPTWSDRTITDPNTGKKYTVRIVQQGQTDGTVTTAPTYLTAAVEVTPDQYVNGDIYIYGRTILTLSNGTNRMSASKLITINFAPVYNQPLAPYALTTSKDMPKIQEGQTSTATWEVVNPDGYTNVTFTWELSNTDGTNPVTASTGTSPVLNVLNTAGVKIGEATVTGNGTRDASVSFTPVPYWHGSASFRIRVSNGGDGNATTDPWGPYTTANVSVDFINSAPTAPLYQGSSTLPDSVEDTTPEYMITWTDPDYDPSVPSYNQNSPQGWRLMVAPDSPTAPAGADPIWQTDFTLITNGRVSILNETTTTATNDLQALIRIEPNANYFTPTGSRDYFWAQVDNLSEPAGSTTKYSPPTRFSFFVTPAEDRPTAPQPNYMPSIENGLPVATQWFTTTDPDSGALYASPWTFEVAATDAGPWGSSVVLSSGVEVVVNDTDLTDKQAVVYAYPHGYVGPYSFYIRVTDALGAPNGESPHTLVTGFVVAAGMSIELRKRVIDATTFTTVPVCPLTPLDGTSYTDSLTGPGGATINVDSGELLSRATAAGVSVQQLLDPKSAEIAIYVNGRLAFAGPVVRFDLGIDDGTARIDASGLAVEFEARRLEPTCQTQFVAQTDGQIVAKVLSDMQALPYGNLGITTAVDNDIVYTRTQSWQMGDSVAAIVQSLNDMENASEMWVTPDRVFRAALRRGSDLRKGKNGVLFTERNSTGIAETASDDKLATVVVITNTTVNDPTTGVAVLASSQADTGTLAKYGRIVRYIDTPHVYTNAAAQVLADQIVARKARQYEAPKFTHVVLPDAPFGVDDYGVGDAVTIEIDDSVLGSFKQDVRIVSRTVNLVSGTPGAYLVDLTVEVIPRNADGSLGTIQPVRLTGDNMVMNMLYDALYSRRA